MAKNPTVGHAPGEALSLKAWIERWLDTYAPLRCRSRKTIERYREVARYVTRGTTDELAAAAATKIADLSHGALESAVLSLVSAPAIRRDRLSHRTIRSVGSLLSVALEKASLLDMLPANPMDKVELPSFESKPVRSLTPAEVRKLRDVCSDDWTFPLIELALASGCRRGELLALEWTDIDWDAKTLTVSKSLEETREGLRIKCTKGGRPRKLTLARVAIDSLQAVRSERKLIFATPDDAYLRPVLVSQIVVRRMRRAGIVDASIHTLRHTHATILLSRGVPLPVISARLGHADPNVTARIYCHALPCDDQRAAIEWDALLAS
jgi:integrase